MSTEALAALRAEAKTLGWTLNTRVRKLASGPKRYFRVRAPHPGCSSAVTYFNDIIAKHFPDAYLTSGSMGSGGPVDLTFAEGPPL